MLRRACLKMTIYLLLALSFGNAAQAQGIPVIDVAAVLQLMQQIQYWMDQIKLMKTQLGQLQRTYAAETGTRGMENLLGASARNYLPADWNQMTGVMNNNSVTYSGLANQVRAVMNANAVLSKAQLQRLSSEQQHIVEEGRKSVATMQVMKIGRAHV